MRTQWPPAALPGVPRRAGVLPWGRRLLGRRVITHFPRSPLSAPRWAPRPSGCRRAALSSTREDEVSPCVASSQASPCHPPLLPRGHLCPGTRIPREGLRRRAHRGPQRKPSMGSARLGLAPGGLGGCHTFLPHQGRRSQEPRPGWPWVWPGPEETREPGLGRCPWGLQVSSSRLHSPERGSTEGAFQAGKGRSRCVPDVGTCSRKSKAAVQRPSPRPAVRQPWGQAWRPGSFPFCPGSGPLSSWSLASLTPAGCGRQGPALALAS